MSSKTALITGVGGQDGSHLADLLLAKGYKVVGTTRSPAADRPGGLFVLAQWDLRDEVTLRRLIEQSQPDEIYNFAAYSTGAGMFDEPVGIGDINGLTVTRILEAIRTQKPATRFCQASSSEMFGAPAQSPQSEETPLRPLSPYGAAKLYGHNMVDIYRRRYGVFATSAIFFNHESPRRGPGFVTRRVTDGAARIKLGLADDLAMGNLDARRDWGFSGDYVRGAWLMLQADIAEDFVFATGQTHSVRDLCEIAFSHVGLDYQRHVRQEASAARPHETVAMTGNAAKAAAVLDWRPTMTFSDMICQMVDAELKRLSQHQPAPE